MRTPFARAWSVGLLGAGLSLTLALGACGSVEEADAEQETSSGDPITLTDGRGEEITLDGPADEVVALEWVGAENLVSLGVMPVGVADVEGYTNWVSAAPLEDGVADVGTRSEPSVDAIVALDPDLVIATSDLPANVIDQIEEFVPVLAIRAAAAERPIDQMRDNLELIASAVDRSEEADQLLAGLDVAVAAGADAISAAGLQGRGFVLADGYLEGSTVSIRMFTDGSLAGAAGEALGLDNVWQAEGDPDYGLAQTDVEGLTALGDIEFVYYSNDAAYSEPADQDPFAVGLAGNAIWDSLPFVTNGNVHRLPDGIWMFGGPLSVEQFIDATVTAVTS